jgi:hypothetical protein
MITDGSNVAKAHFLTAAPGASFFNVGNNPYKPAHRLRKAERIDTSIFPGAHDTKIVAQFGTSLACNRLI